MAAPDLNGQEPLLLRIRHQRQAVLAIGERLDNAFGLVLMLVFATFAVASLTPFRGWTGVCITALGAFSATFALRTARARTVVTRWGGRLAALAVIAAAVGAVSDTRQVFGVSAILMALLLAVGALAVLRAVVTEEQVGFRTILGAVSVYLTLVLLFAFVYVGVDKVGGKPFFSQPPGTGDFLYFSATTLTTTGYGDFVPAAQPGRMLANIEMLIGQIFLVTLIARLVSMWTPGHWLRSGASLARTDEPGDPE